MIADRSFACKEQSVVRGGRNSKKENQAASKVLG